MAPVSTTVVSAIFCCFTSSHTAPDLLTAKKERRVLIETARFLRVSVCIKT
jgi:hypothetical protein